MGNATLYLGDCLELLPSLVADAVISDPPYGMGWDTDTSRFSGGAAESKARRGAGRSDVAPVVNDNKPFDPSPWLSFRKVILWGANHFAARLPVGTTLVWIKRLDAAFGSFLSDAEIGWQKGGHGVYCRRDVSMTAEAKMRVHPTQKPVGVMAWCVQRIGDAETILDPYMGSGTTGVACADLGRKFIGVEIDPKYYEIALQRISATYSQGRLFA